MLYAYDVSFGHAALSTDELVAVGARGVLGYVGADPRKCLTPDDEKRFHDAGIPVAHVHEIGLDWRAWNPDAANRDCDRLGVPGERPIYYAVDRQAFPSEYAAISDRLGGMTGRPSGVYGGKGLGHFCLREKTAGWAWGTNATSFDNGDHDQTAIALQQLFNQSPISSTDTDKNLILLADWGQHPYKPPQGDDEVPQKIGTMLAAPKTYEANYGRDDNPADVAKRGTPFPPGVAGEIVYCAEGSKVASHVTRPEMVDVYQFVGVGGPTTVTAMWYEDLTILPAGHLSVPVQ